MSAWRNRQTRSAKDAVVEIPCRFKSYHRHHCFLVANKNDDAEPQGSKICPSGAVVAHLTFNQVAESSSLSSDTIWAPSLIGNYRGTACNKYGGDLMQLYGGYYETV